MGTTAAFARAAGPFRDYGQDGAADALSLSTPRHADDLTTLPAWGGPTRQSDARDSEPDYAPMSDEARVQCLNISVSHFR